MDIDTVGRAPARGPEWALGLAEPLDQVRPCPVNWVKSPVSCDNTAKPRVRSRQ